MKIVTIDLKNVKKNLEDSSYYEKYDISDMLDENNIVMIKDIDDLFAIGIKKIYDDMNTITKFYIEGLLQDTYGINNYNLVDISYYKNSDGENICQNIKTKVK